MPDKLNLGLSLTVIGIAVVFLILFLLQILMSLEAYIFNSSSLKRKPSNSNHFLNNNVSPKQTVTTADVQNHAVVSEKPQNKISPQVIAAIMGAIAYQTGKPIQKFRLVSIRQAWDREASAAWNFNSRIDVINRRNSFYSKGGSK